MRACRATSRFSTTVSCANSSPCWKVRARPSRAMRCGASRVMSRPPNAIAAAQRPVDAADAVQHRGLARTVGADQAQQLACAGLEGDVLQHLQAAEGECDALEAEVVSHTSGGCGGTA